MKTTRGSYDLNLPKETHDDAKTKATNYIQDITGGGIYIHADDTNWSPSTGDSVKITDQNVDIIKGGTSISQFGSDLRLGPENKSRFVISSKNMKAISSVLVYRDPDVYSTHTYFDLGNTIGSVIDLEYEGDGNNRLFISYYPNGGSSWNDIYIDDVLYTGTVYSYNISYPETMVCWFPDEIITSNLHIELTYLDTEGNQQVIRSYGGDNISADIPYGCTPISLVESVTGSSETKTYTDFYYKHLDTPGYYNLFWDFVPENGSTIRFECHRNYYISNPYLTFGNREEGVIGDNSITLGSDNQASGSNAIAIGRGARAASHDSIAISSGGETKSFGGNAVAIGHEAVAMGYNSVALGSKLSAGSDFQVVTGVGNEIDLEKKYAFIVGIGKSVGQYKNGLTVDWNGEITDGYNMHLPFIVYRGVTTFSEITAAVNAGKAIFAIDNTGTTPIYYTYVWTEGSNKHWFSRTQANPIVPRNIYLVCNDDNTWDTHGKQNSRTLALGNYLTVGQLTSSAGSLSFSIPTGRIFPSGTTISKITFTMVARGSNSQGTGVYIVKSASGGTGGQAFDSSTTTKFYNGNNVQKSLTSAMWTGKSIQGQTNIYIAMVSGADHFFSGTSTITNYINNNAATVTLNSINVTLNLP